MSVSQEKRLYGLVLILVVAMAIVSGLVIYTSYSRPAITPPPGPEAKTISVGGTGTISMNPDIGWFTATVSTQAQTAAQAEEENSNAMTKVIQALKATGIAEDDIQTVEFSLNPIYQEAKEPGKMPILVGYSVRHMIRVTVNDLLAIGRIIDLAISNGANEVGGVYFGLSKAKADQAQAQALDLAVKDANNKANTIASSMGVTLVGPTSVSLGYYYEPVRVEYSALPKEVPVMPGQLQYTVSVQITYAFK